MENKNNYTCRDCKYHTMDGIDREWLKFDVVMCMVRDTLERIDFAPQCDYYKPMKIKITQGSTQ